MAVSQLLRTLLRVLDEGTDLGDFTDLDFRGSGVTVVDVGGGQARVVVSSGAGSFDGDAILSTCEPWPNNPHVLFDCRGNVVVGC